MGKESIPRTREPDREDRRLMDQWRQATASGDREAQNRIFESIWHRHVATVSFVCARYLRDDDEILGATDEVFLRLLKASPTLTLTVPLRAYLATLAKHVAIDILRASARREAHLSLPLPEEDDPLGSIPDPEADVGASLRYRELIDSLLSVLSREEVEIILGHAVYGETFGALADRLHKKENTVKTVYHRALKTYRKKKGGDRS